ncbi:MAG: FeoB-associated Cys-rich membrane protein [Sphaerochaeta sp.]
MIVMILSNIVVALLIILMLWYAVHTIRKQRKEDGCGSCKKNSAHSCPSSGCKGCSYSNKCH